MSANPVERRRRRDALLLGLTLLLVVLAGLTWWAWTAAERDVRAQTLAGLPPFPSAPGAGARRLEHAGRLSGDAGGPARAPPPGGDRFSAFVTAPAPNLAVLQVNALVNTPFVARLRACLPAGVDPFGDAGTALGFDPSRDLDRVALLPNGLAMSGTFDPELGARWAVERGMREHRRYRDADVYASPTEGCLAQVGSMLLTGGPDACEGLVDRALDSPAPGPESSTVLDSDIYVRSDLAALRELSRSEPSDSQLSAITDNLQQITLRANVWEQVALSVDGVPADSNKHLEDLTSLVRLSVEASKSQLADDPAWSALLERARASSGPTGFHVDLALPAEQLFEHLQLPCPGRDGGLP